MIYFIGCNLISLKKYNNKDERKRKSIDFFSIFICMLYYCLHKSKINFNRCIPFLNVLWQKTIFFYLFVISALWFWGLKRFFFFHFSDLNLLNLPFHVTIRSTQYQSKVAKDIQPYTFQEFFIFFLFLFALLQIASCAFHYIFTASYNKILFLSSLPTWCFHQLSQQQQQSIPFMLLLLLR